MSCCGKIEMIFGEQYPFELVYRHSVLLKLFFAEPESVRKSEIVSDEPDITVSSLTRLETLIQIQRREAIGMLTSAKAGRRRQRLERLVTLSPFKLQTCPSALIPEAERQVLSVTTYWPTLDRLHLAAMQLFHLRRLLTNDDTQAKAAHELGFEVILPRSRNVQLGRTTSRRRVGKLDRTVNLVGTSRTRLASETRRVERFAPIASSRLIGPVGYEAGTMAAKFIA
jgi:hypothetical protein